MPNLKILKFQEEMTYAARRCRGAKESETKTSTLFTQVNTELCSLNPRAILTQEQANTIYHILSNCTFLRQSSLSFLKVKLL